MTREEIYNQCVQKIDKTSCLLMELATGTGKTKISIDLVNYILKNKFHSYANKCLNILILVAKRVHKQTWKEEIEKWGGITSPNSDTEINICMECYESLHKHVNERFEICIMDECHHINSEMRIQFLKEISFYYIIGLSATIPLKVKQFFKYRYHSECVSCNIQKAVESNILPEPKILLFPLLLDNRADTETWEINAKTKGKVVYGGIRDIWKYKRQKVHAILACTQKQKIIQFNKLIDWEKEQYMVTRREPLKQSWLFHAGKRLEYLSDIKVPIIKSILRHLKTHRTITFCRSIAQAEEVSNYCIHSKNAESDQIYNDFNQMKIDHISAVNILNENANLVNCKYAVFCNMSSSDISVPQRIGRALRHPEPVIIIPYYKDTREQELVEKIKEGFDPKYIQTIHSLDEII